MKLSITSLAKEYLKTVWTGCLEPISKFNGHYEEYRLLTKVWSSSSNKELFNKTIERLK